VQPQLGAQVLAEVRKLLTHADPAST